MASAAQHADVGVRQSELGRGARPLRAIAVSTPRHACAFGRVAELRTGRGPVHHEQVGAQGVHAVAARVWRQPQLRAIPPTVDSSSA
eukprot:scaffold57078_cov32-Tisochrysis_lutea.AAC.1